MMNARYNSDYPTITAPLPVDINFSAPQKVYAYEIMSKSVISVDPDTEIKDVIKLLSDRNITGVLVEEDGLLVGVVSEKDTFKLLLQEGFTQAPTGVVREIMSTYLTTVKAMDDIFHIAQLFYTNSFRRLPVVEGGKVIGIISRKDVLKSIKNMGFV